MLHKFATENRQQPKGRETVRIDEGTTEYRVITQDGPFTQTNSIRVLGDGLNYRNHTGELFETRNAFQPVDDGFLVETGPIKAHLPAILFQNPIRITTPDRIVLKSWPLSINYFEPASGRSLMLAAVEPVEGILISSNVVVYPLCFDGLRASLRYIYGHGGEFHQEVVFHEAPPSPESLGLKSARLEMITEFDEATPEPRRIRKPLPTWKAPESGAVEADFTDEILYFGDHVQFGHGRALLAHDSLPWEPPVGKAFTRVQNRLLLIEAIHFQDLKPAFARLPKAASIDRQLHGDRIPAPRPAVLNRPKRELPSQGYAALFSKPGVILDYVITQTGAQGSLTLAANTTYWIKGPVTVNGTLTIEGGTVVKFAPGSSSLRANGSIVCKTEPYCPAIFTSECDETIGERLPDTDPTPAFYGSAYLEVNSAGAQLKYVHFRNALRGIQFNDVGPYNYYGQSVRHAQFINCSTAIMIYGNTSSPNAVTCDNLLISGGSFAFSAYGGVSVNASHVTAKGVITLCSSWTGSYSSNPFTFRNSIFASITSLLSPGSANATLGGTYNGFYQVPATFGS
ncbi:MAG: hypothetical protein AB1813_22690, partial [Verrucomicrobiota bacterium]